MKKYETQITDAGKITNYILHAQAIDAANSVIPLPPCKTPYPPFKE